MGDTQGLRLSIGPSCFNKQMSLVSFPTFISCFQLGRTTVIVVSKNILKIHLVKLKFPNAYTLWSHKAYNTLGETLRYNITNSKVFASTKYEWAT